MILSPATSATSSRRTLQRWLVVGFVAYVALLIVLGIALHPMAVKGGESDGYVERARVLLDGQLSVDSYHGFLVPELIAAVSFVVGDVFAAGRVVGSLAAGAFLLAGWGLGVTLGGRRCAVWGAVLLVVNGGVFVLGMQGASDLPAAALFALAVWRAFAGGPSASSLLVGVLAGLAGAARLNLLPMVPVVAVIVAFRGDGGGNGRRLRRAVTCCAGAAIGYLPHAIPSLVALGSPLSTTNWHNLALKLSGNFDGNALLTPPYSSLGELLRVDGLRLLQMGVSDFGTLATSGVAECLVGSTAPRAAVQSVGWLAVIAAFGFVLAAGARRSLLAGALCGSLCGMAALTFYPQPRLLLPVVPLLVSATVVGCARLCGRATVVFHAVCGAWAACTVLGLVRQIPSFVDSHPVAEVAAAREIAAEKGPAISIASCYPQMASNVAAHCVYVYHVPADRHGPEAVYAQLAASLAKEPADYFVVGPATCAAATTAELSQAVPSGATVVRCEPGVLVLQLPHRDVAWLGRSELLPLEPGRVRLSIDILEGVQAWTTGFTVWPPGGEPTLVPLQRIGDRHFETVMETKVAGVWRFVPGVYLTTGEVRHGEPIRHEEKL